MPHVTGFTNPKPCLRPGQRTICGGKAAQSRQNRRRFASPFAAPLHSYPSHPVPTLKSQPPANPIQVEVTTPSHPDHDLALARRLLAAEARAIDALAASLGPSFSRAVDLLIHCADRRGNILISGLGKSGLIGQKISATLASLGLPSHFVHPAEAAHGDLGRFRREDVCILISSSGTTAETINLAALLHQDGLPLIGICAGTPDRSSPLERLCDPVLALGPVSAADADFSPAPTCSTTATLALGDALALCAAQRRGFSDDDFAKRHPGGALGEMLRPVTDILRFVVGKNLTPVRDDLSVWAALEAAQGHADRRPGAMLLVNAAGALTGIFTDADVRRRYLKRDPADYDRPIASVMTRGPKILPHTARVRDAVQLVRESRLDEVPVVDDQHRPVGILDVQDLVALKLVQND